jgi:hypothetical protein
MKFIHKQEFNGDGFCHFSWLYTVVLHLTGRSNNKRVSVFEGYKDYKNIYSKQTPI